MLVGLPVVSFLCAGLLGLLAPAPRIRSDAAQLSLVCWLILCNLIHGVNSLVWSSNTDIHIPSWCDLVTNVLLGALVALPGACLCLSSKLERVSSKRPISDDAYSRRSRMLFDVIFCVLIPILYMTLHLIVQDNRFDIVEDFGCSPAIHPSIPGLIIIWLPPLVFCIISFIFSGLAVHHSSRQPLAQLSVHIPSRGHSSVSLFTRQLATTLILTAVLMIFTLFSMFSRSLGPWLSWSHVHEHFYEIAIVRTDDELRAAELMWWGIPVVSIFYLALAVTIGEDVRDAAKHLRALISNWKPRKPRIKPLVLALPLHRSSNTSPPRMPSSSPKLGQSKEDFVSGWDDMLNMKAPKRQRPKSSIADTSRTTSSASRSSSLREQSRVSSPEDQAFAASTLQYLHSPTAHTLGLHSPIASPPPIYVPKSTPMRDRSDSETVSSSSSYPAKKQPSRPTMDDGESIISSIIEIPWPQPPATLSPRSAAQSRPHSPAFSEASSGIALSHLPPFHGPTISPVPEDVRPIFPLDIACRPSSPIARIPSVRKHLRRHNRGPPEEVIYMTIVQETV